MTLNQINYFLAVAKYLNYTQAASSLFVSQSTLSRSISALEKEIGASLIQRDFHYVTLTPAGEIMNREMQSVVTKINTIIRQVQDAASLKRDKFVIGILEGQQIDSKLLLALRSMSDRHPQFSIDVKRMGYQELIEEIKANHIDIAESIITRETVLDTHIASVPIRKVKSYLLARNDDPIWESKPTLATVDGKTLVVSEKSHPGVDALKHRISQAGLHPFYKVASDMETFSLLLEAGMGLTICSENNIVYASRNFRPLNTIVLEELEDVSIALLWNKEYPSSIVKEFILYIQSDVPPLVEI